jgi:hypothetical protein
MVDERSVVVENIEQKNLLIEKNPNQNRMIHENSFSFHDEIFLPMKKHSLFLLTIEMQKAFYSINW